MFLTLRRWFLDLSVEVTDERVVKFLLNRFKAADVSANEAGQTLLVALHHLTVTPELVEMSKVRSEIMDFSFFP